MTMPTAEDNISLAEIVRTMKDFREEFRSTVGTLMRTDVYQAQQATLRAEIATAQAALRAEIDTVRASFSLDVSGLQSKVTDIQKKDSLVDAEKRQRNMALYGALVAAAISVVLTLLNLK